ncbi:MAG: PAS domain S-box protein, partial [Myxococcales bacterium]|nr:PAS domain S-box protein [Myxococcales bacterium]
AALSEEALFLSAVLESVDTGIVMTDAQGRVRLVNARFEVLFGVRGSELIGRPHGFLRDALADGFADPSAFRDAAERFYSAEERPPGSVRTPGERAPDEAELVRKEPTRRVLLYSVVPVLQGEQQVGTLEIYRDVTAQRDAEEAQHKLMLQLEARATTDALTGLKNRRAANEALALELVRAQRYERSLPPSCCSTSTTSRRSTTSWGTTWATASSPSSATCSRGARAARTSSRAGAARSSWSSSPRPTRPARTPSATACGRRSRRSVRSTSAR